MIILLKRGLEFIMVDSKVDSLDNKIISILAKDARQSSNLIAKQLDVSASTIRRRIQNLIDNKTIRIMGIADPVKVGYPVTAYIAFNMAMDKVDAALKTLAGWPEIRTVSTIAGRFDILAMARFHSNDDLSDFLTRQLPKIKGLKDSETFICLHMEKGLEKQD